MNAFHFLIQLKSVQLIFVSCIFSLQLFAQKNSDGSYTIKDRHGKFVTYFPQHPGNSNYVVDTLAVGKTDLYFRLSDRKKIELRKPEGSSTGDLSNYYKSDRKTMYHDGSIGTQHSSYQSCDCVVDTLIIEQPDGSFQQFFQIRDPKNGLKQESIVRADKQITTTDVYENAEQMPSFEDGNNDIKQYIEKNLKFDNNGKRYVNRLYLKFVVLQNGKIEKVLFENTYGDYPAALQSELIRILKIMPAWKPGKVNGKAVNAYYNFQMLLVI